MTVIIIHEEESKNSDEVCKSWLFLQLNQQDTDFGDDEL